MTPPKESSSSSFSSSSSMTPPNQHHPPKAAFDHEKLRVYQMELEFLAWVSPLIDEARTSARGKAREVCDQLDRASLSALLNTAEGNGKRQGQIRAKYFDDARGSATECAACLDAMVAKGIFAADIVNRGKAMLVQIVSMLCGLIERFDALECRCHEARAPYFAGEALNPKKAEADEETEDEALGKRKRKRKRTI